MAGLLAQEGNLLLSVEPRLRERHFGTWEGRLWDEIWKDVGFSMDGMLTAPATYRPGGGETTTELASRVRAWFLELPPGISVVVVTHGGPIGSLVGQLIRLDVSGWPKQVPLCGWGVLLESPVEK